MNQRSKRGKGQLYNYKKPKNARNEESMENKNLSPVIKMFMDYQSELDTRYDKYERLVKKSRDLTIESKRIIFLLHRVTGDQNNEEILEQAAARLNDLFKNVIHEIALELSKREVFQFIRAFSPGLQEYVEAVSFYHYLKHGSIIHIKEVQNPDFIKHSITGSAETVTESTLPSPEISLSEILTPADFILGIADLTGELMRKCINSVASGNIDEPFELCSVLQNVYEAFLTKCNYSRELKRKTYTLQNSLRKVENACYAIKIRGSEIPQHMLADFFSNDEEFEDLVTDE